MSVSAVRVMGFIFKPRCSAVGTRGEAETVCLMMNPVRLYALTPIDLCWLMDGQMAQHEQQQSEAMWRWFFPRVAAPNTPLLHLSVALL